MVNQKIKLRKDLEKLRSEIRIKPKKKVIAIEEFIGGYTKKLNREGVILGLSGGVDSAVVASLCKGAVGSDNVLALIMPEMDSNRENIRDALNFARKINIKFKLINMTPYLKKLGVYKLFALNKIPLTKKYKGVLTKRAYDYYTKRMGQSPFEAGMLGVGKEKFSSYLKMSTAYYRIKHRLRMILLYKYAEMGNRLVVGAANRTEESVGYFVKHGCDDAADIMPILNLYKTQVRQLARYLNVPSKIVEKTPSPDILPGITDEGALRISYEKLDLILLSIEKKWTKSRIANILGVKEEKVTYVNNLIKKSEHMRRVFVPKN